MKFSEKVAAIASALGLCFLVGCGSSAGPKLPEGPTGSAKAKVSYQGKAITTGTLSLDSGKGFVASAPASPDGTFALKGPTGEQVPAGSYKVGITPPPNPPPAAGATSMPPPPKIEGLPEKFYNSGTSGVTVEIKAGSQDLDIKLE